MNNAAQRCARCLGCGKVAGAGREERAWSEFQNVPTHLLLERVLGMHCPRPCPACHGSGVILHPDDHSTPAEANRSAPGSSEN